MDIGEDIWLNIAMQVDIKDSTDLNSLYCVNKSANRVLSSPYFWKLKYDKDGLEYPNDVNLSLGEYYVHYKSSYYVNLLTLGRLLVVDTNRSSIVRIGYTIEGETLSSIVYKINSKYSRYVGLYNVMVIRNRLEELYEISMYDKFGVILDIIPITKHKLMSLLQQLVRLRNGVHFERNPE